MSVAILAGREIHVDEEGFLTEYEEWDEALAAELAGGIGIELTDPHLRVIRFLRSDFKTTGQTPTLRRVKNIGGFQTKELFSLFPKKPAKKMAYIAGLAKPAGCV